MLRQRENKSISLKKETLNLLKIQADKKGIDLSAYIESILENKANNFELSNEYKSEMDNILNKHKKGNLKYFDKENFFKRIKLNEV